MKNLFKLFFTMILLIGLTTACVNDTNYYDDIPPSPPTGVETLTGDNWVEISWDYNSENDVAGYNIYYNYTYEGKYTLIGSTEGNFFLDDGAENGNTYYYAVAAYDYNGNESELSYDMAYDTPRPEGYNQRLFDASLYPDISGYDFSDYNVIAFDDLETDFFFEYYEGKYYITVWQENDIQDMGATYDIYDVTEAPLTGYAPIYEGENVKYEEAIVGHTYVIWTFENNFAKIRINQIHNDKLIFDWAYQLVPGNVELKPRVKEFKAERKIIRN